MRQRLLAFAVLLACASVLGATQTITVIDLAPSGRVLAEDIPTLKGDNYYFHRLSDGTLMTLKKSDVKSIYDYTLAPSWARGVTEIANLPMEGGGSSQAGPTNARNAGRTPAQGVGTGFYGNVVPGATTGMPNSMNDYAIGRTFAAPPANAYQSSPGAPPQAAPPR
jgi:hypothetical protein